MSFYVREKCTISVHARAMNRYLETAIFVSFANYFERKQKGNIILDHNENFTAATFINLNRFRKNGSC